MTILYEIRKFDLYDDFYDLRKEVKVKFNNFR